MWQEKMILLAKNRKLQLLGSALVSSATGAIVGYQLAVRKLESQYTERSNREIAEAKQFYASLKKPDTPADAVQQFISGPKPNLEAAAKALLEYQGEDVEDEITESETIVEVNVFEKAEARSGGFNLENEMKNRTEEEPYIINHDEYMSSDSDYEQTTLTYYAGDEVLVDDKDEPIQIVEDVIRVSNMRFGYGSGDPNTVFIRNDRLSLDFEVVKSEGKYAEEVLGFEHSDISGFRHPNRSDHSKNRKFRDGDE